MFWRCPKIIVILIWKQLFECGWRSCLVCSFSTILSMGMLTVKRRKPHPIHYISFGCDHYGEKEQSDMNRIKWSNHTLARNSPTCHTVCPRRRRAIDISSCIVAWASWVAVGDFDPLADRLYMYRPHVLVSSAVWPRPVCYKLKTDVQWIWDTSVYPQLCSIQSVS